MRLPASLSTSLLTSAATVILLVSMPQTRAADIISRKSPSPHARVEPFIVTRAKLDFGTITVGQRKPLDDPSVWLFQAMAEEGDPTLNRSQEDLLPAQPRKRGPSFNLALASRSGDGARNISFVPSGAKPVLASGNKRMGTEDGTLNVEPETMEFGTIPTGFDENQVGTLTASGSDVTVSSATIDNPQFTLSGLSFPFVIPAGGNQQYTVTFTPQSVGATTATLTFVTDANWLAKQGLVGIGGQSSHMVDLSWDASTSQDVSGYNIYRSTTSGGPYAKINSVLDPNTVYTDAGVSDGATYYYVTTAVDTSGRESVYSNETQAIIP